MPFFENLECVLSTSHRSFNGCVDLFYVGSRSTRTVISKALLESQNCTPSFDECPGDRNGKLTFWKEQGRETK